MAAVKSDGERRMSVTWAMSTVSAVPLLESGEVPLAQGSRQYLGILGSNSSQRQYQSSPGIGDTSVGIHPASRSYICLGIAHVT